MRKAAIAIVGLALVLFARPALAGRGTVRWDHTAVLDTVYDSNVGKLQVTWSPASGLVDYYEVCYAVKSWGKICSQVNAAEDLTKSFDLTAVGSCTVTVTAYDDADFDPENGFTDDARIKTRLTIQ